MSPRDPAAFRAKVLRRAAQLERRRRRMRLVATSSVGVAALLGGMLLTQSAQDDRPSVTAGPDATTGTLRSEVVATPAAPRSMALRPDGALWLLTEDEAGPAIAVVRAGEPVTELVRLPADARPEKVVSGIDGRAFLTDPVGRRVLVVQPGGAVDQIPTASPPSGSSTVDPRGRLWFAEPERSRLTALWPDGTLHEHPLPAGRRPTVLTDGPGGSIWFGSSDIAAIGSMAPDGGVLEYELDDPTARVVAVATGPGPALWYAATSSEGTRLGRVGAQAELLDQRIQGRAPRALAQGPDGRLWFTTGRAAEVRQRNLARFSTKGLDREVLAHEWALDATGTMWAIDLDRERLLRIVED